MGLFIILVYVKVGGRRVYNARAVGVRSISVTNVLAVETSERMVHRALIAQKPQALAATLHPDATRAVAEFLLHKVMSTREAGRVLPERVVPGAGAPVWNQFWASHAIDATLSLLRLIDGVEGDEDLSQ